MAANLSAATAATALPLLETGALCLAGLLVTQWVSGSCGGPCRRFALPPTAALAGSLCAQATSCRSRARDLLRSTECRGGRTGNACALVSPSACRGARRRPRHRLAVTGVCPSQGLLNRQRRVLLARLLIALLMPALAFHGAVLAAGNASIGDILLVLANACARCAPHPRAASTVLAPFAQHAAAVSSLVRASIPRHLTPDTALPWPTRNSQRGAGRPRRGGRSPRLGA